MSSYSPFATSHPTLQSYRMLTALLIAAAVVLITTGRAAAKASPNPRLSRADQATLVLINRYRASHHLRPLTVDSHLERSSTWMAADLATHPYFGHTDSLGRSPFDRIDDFGYSVRAWTGENLDAGQQSPAAALQVWRRSPEHNANLLDPRYRHIGIAARTAGSGSGYATYWVTDFGS